MTDTTDTTTKYEERMPDALAGRCREALREGESVRIAAATDLTEDLRFEERWLVVTDQRLMRFDTNGAGTRGRERAQGRARATGTPPSSSPTPKAPPWKNWSARAGSTW